MKLRRIVTGIVAGLAVITLLGICARELRFKLTHIDISKIDQPVEKVDITAMIDMEKLSKALRWPPYPKEAFIGTTREKGSDWVTGWYVKISSDNSMSAPYVGFIGSAEPIKVIFRSKIKNSQKNNCEFFISRMRAARPGFPSAFSSH